MLRFLFGHCWQWEPSTISLLTRCLLTLQAAASQVDERIGKSRGKKGEFFVEENKYGDMETERAANRAGFGFDGAAGWLSECKASSLNLSECSIKPLFYKTRAKILGGKPTQVKISFTDVRKLPIKGNKPNSTVREAGLDMSALHTACQRPITPEACARSQRGLLRPPCCHTNLLQCASGHHTQKQ